MASCANHKSVKERSKTQDVVQWLHLCDELIRSHDQKNAVLSINASKIKDVRSVLQVGAKDLFIIDQAITAFRRQKHLGQGFEPQGPVVYLEGVDSGRGQDRITRL